MVDDNSLTVVDRRRVFLNRAIRNIVQKHSQVLGHLLADFGAGRVTEILRVLLEKRVFESEIQARALFPELYLSSPAQDIQRAESESNAVRSTAELIQEIESADSQGEDLNLERNEAAKLEPSIEVRPYEGKEAQSSCIVDSHEIPSLYPLRFSYIAQHQVLNTVQTILEESCFDFAQKWLPHIVESRRIECAASVELTKWVPILKAHWNKLPAEATTMINGVAAREALAETSKLRHAAVHRLPITAREISRYVLAGCCLTQCLLDPIRAGHLDELHQETEKKIKDMELHKNALEKTLKDELDLISAKRKGLDEQESSCIKKMITEDRENRTLVATLLMEFVERLSKGSQEQDVYSEGDGSDEDNAGVLTDHETNLSAQIQ